MRRNLLSALLAGGFMTAALAAQEPGAAGGVEKPAAAKTPAFKDADGKAAFEEGVELFQKGEYRAAAGIFRKAGRSAKSREDRDTVSSWYEGASRLSKSERHLQMIRTLIEKGDLQRADALAEKLRPALAGTPAMAVWKEVVKDLDLKLTYSLETFDVQKSIFSPKYGKTYVSEEGVPFRGERCLRWKNTQDLGVAALKLGSVPRDWTVYDAVEFWVRSDQSVPVEVYIMADSTGSKPGGQPPVRRAPGAPQTVEPTFMSPVVLRSPPGQWHRVRLNLATFQSQGDPSLSAVKDFRIQIRKGRKFDLLIDDVRLVKKPEAPPGSDRGARRRG